MYGGVPNTEIQYINKTIKNVQTRAPMFNLRSQKYE